jgi:hypothetical protein
MIIIAEKPRAYLGYKALLYEEISDIPWTITTPAESLLSFARPHFD